MRYLLDTDTCVFALKHQADVRRRFGKVSPDDVAVSAMTLAELRYGSLRSKQPGKTWREVEAFLEPIRVLPFDEGAALAHAELRLALRAKPIGERDLVIASVAAARRLAVVTHNTREFARVPGLVCEDWSLGVAP
ncbi:MAG: type II toxin-antitoxin system VapC family toxin [Holophagaceae bacterium]